LIKRLRRLGPKLLLSLVAVLALAGTALAASTVSITTPANTNTAITGTVTLDTSATLGTGHYYVVDAGTNQALTVTGTTFSISVAGLADGNHSLQAVVLVDEDGAGPNPAVQRSASVNFTTTAGAVAVAAPPTGGTGLTFTVPTSGIGTATSTSLTSMSPLFYIAGGLVVAGGILGWGIRMLKSWQGGH
jgi:hypothetical protein